MVTIDTINSAVKKERPKTIKECHQLIDGLYELIGQLSKDMARQMEMEALNASIEKIEYSLFQEDALPKEEKSDDSDSEEETKKKDKKKKKGHGRRSIPPELERHEINLDLNDDEKICDDCGRTLDECGVDESEQYCLIPLQLFVLHYNIHKYVCRDCKNRVYYRPKPAEPIEKSSAHATVLASIITSKYCDHLPLYRQEQILKRHGADIPRQTMCDWLMRCSELLLPIVMLMMQRLKNCHIVHIDDTYLMQQTKLKKGLHRGHLWAVIGDENAPYQVYRYRPARNRDGPEELLDGFEGYVQADACNVYDKYFEKTSAIEVGCWKHSRDNYEDSMVTDRVRAEYVMDQIKELYKIERKIRDEAPVVRFVTRQTESKNILDDLKEWLEVEINKTLPKSPIAGAINYTLNNWTALTRFLDDERLSIDNNIAERAFSPVGIGRRNYHFVGSEGGGDAAAVYYSLIESAKRHGKNPHLYILDLLDRISTHPQSRLEELLPDVWEPQIGSTNEIRNLLAQRFPMKYS